MEVFGKQRWKRHRRKEEQTIAFNKEKEAVREIDQNEGRRAAKEYLLGWDQWCLAAATKP